MGVVDQGKNVLGRCRIEVGGTMRRSSTCPRWGCRWLGYRLEATLGSGGQGTVFRARREGLPFAVKFISLSRGSSPRLQSLPSPFPKPGTPWPHATSS